jgi:hydrogenase maturation protein HypF
VDSSETKNYPFELVEGAESTHPIQVGMRPMFAALLDDQRRGVKLPVISARFHNGVAQMVVEVCTRLRQETGVRTAALSGGVWQNLTLLTAAQAGLQAAGFTVHIHQQVPANDGGLALGQAAIGAAQLRGAQPTPEFAAETPAVK